ncbi:RHS repeat-associated core domain-containing protein [Corallococcus llansteffanensis]|uniref:RHS repeat-associated core domain-containing protein n=1 Tax=Corallococcus llansteffanensis TaxID=2316731 RepID=A0A3A8QJE0_9BACT|nr:RHS repeat-associated core domain-containing protein [Corallococcus llansteffanensis]RKH67998.1 RHS repeat-associated core domain-containing protein [Corallococcus llansteffanensis]
MNIRVLWLSALRLRVAFVVMGCLLVAAGAIALTNDGEYTEDELNEKVAQASLNPLPDLGGPGQYGLSDVSPVTLGSLKSSHSHTDLKIGSPFGKISFSRSYTGATSAWREGKPSTKLNSPFGKIAATGSFTGDALQWWHGWHSFILIRETTECNDELPPYRECEQVVWWDVHGGPAGTKNSFRACETEGCFGNNESEQVLKVQRSMDGFVVHSPSGRYHYRDFRAVGAIQDLPLGRQILWSGAYYLSYVESPQYDEPACALEGKDDAGTAVSASCHHRTIRFDYKVPDECGGPNASQTLGAAFPVLASATSANGARFDFHYVALPSRVPALIGKTHECVLASIDIVGRGGAVEQGAVQYSYWNNQAGLLSKVEWLGAGGTPGTTLEYAYVNGQGAPIWEIKQDGALVVRQEMKDAGGGELYVIRDVTEHEGQTISVSGTACAPGHFGTSPGSPCSRSQQQLFTTLAPNQGDGTGTTVNAVNRNFNVVLAGVEPVGDQGPLVREKTTVVFCETGCAAINGQQVTTEAWGWTSLGTAPYAGTIEVASNVRDPNGNYTVYQHSLKRDAGVGFLPQVEMNRVYMGAQSDGGTPLIQRDYTYAYGGEAIPAARRAYEQLVKSDLAPSSFSEEVPGAQVETSRQYDPATNRLMGVVRTGFSWGFSTQAQAWQRQSRSVGTFYLTHDACLGTGSVDAKGRMRTIMGPCQVSGPTASSCDAGGNIPLTTYEYWDDAQSDDRAGHLKAKREYPQGCGSSALVTTFDSYDPRGRLVQKTNSNQVVSRFEYSRDRLVRSINAWNTPLEAVTEYGYDDNATHGDYVKKPSGRYEVLCFRRNTPAGQGCKGGSRSTLLQWKASSTTPEGANYSERVDYTYYLGSLQSETFRDATGQVRRTRHYEGDPLGRKTFEAWGATGPATASATVFSQVSLFDAAGNRVGLGLPYQEEIAAPPPLCEGFEAGTDRPVSPFCKSFAYDKLNRLVNMLEPLQPVLGDGMSAQMCLAYGPDGNLKSVKQGCDRYPTGDCSSCNQPEIEYKYDDFGNVVQVRAPWGRGPQEVVGGGVGRGLFQFEYDASSNLVRKQTPVMSEVASAQQWMEYDYDGLRRPLKAELVKRVSGVDSREALFTYAYDHQVAAPQGCPGYDTSHPALAEGRIQVQNDSFGDTWYQYDVHGNVIGLWKTRAQSGVAPRSQVCIDDSSVNRPNRFFYFDRAGRLGTERLPGGRSILYGYYGMDTADTERIKDVRASVWTGSHWGGMQTVVEDVRWEPFGGLRSYVLVAPDATSGAQRARVEYHRDGTNQPLALCSAAGLGGTGDTTGRLFGLTVSKQESGGALGDIFKRIYTWKADQLVQEDTCLLETGSVPPVSIRYADPTTGNAGYDSRQQLLSAFRAANASAGKGGAFGARTYMYDLLGNRTRDVQEGWEFRTEYGGDGPRVDLLTARYLAGRDCSGALCPPRFTVTQRYTYDADGRLKKLSSYKNVTDATSSPLSTLDFDASTDGRTAALGMVYRQVTDNEGRMYEYFYDASGRRRLKRFPVSSPNRFLEDEYFYDGTRLVEDWGHTSFDPDTADSVRDEYIWLDQRPIALFKARVTQAGVRSVDLVGDCPRNGNAAPCGLYFIVTDEGGKPVMMLDSHRRVAGVGDYEPYGHVNRTTQIAESPLMSVNQSALLATAELPTSSTLLVQARARLSVVDVGASSSVYPTDGEDMEMNSVDGSSARVSSVKRHMLVMKWVQLPPGEVLKVWISKGALAQSRSDAAVAGFEYRRFQPGATPVWTPLRLPGQYHDEETDLMENWNRFYDASLGRFTAPDPLVNSPGNLAKGAGNGNALRAYAYANGNPIGAMDSDGLKIVVSSGDGELSDEDWERYWKVVEEVRDMMNDPVVGEEVRALNDDEDYVLVINALRDSGKATSGSVTPGTQEGENGATVMNLNKNFEKGKYGPVGKEQATTFRETVWHEMGHAVYDFQKRPAMSRSDKGAFMGYVDPEASKKNNEKAIEYMNRRRALIPAPPIAGHRD